MAAKKEIAYGFWVGMGLLLAIGAWGLVSMLLGGRGRKMADSYGG